MNKQEIAAQIIKNADIYMLISQDVALKKKGTNYFGLCPFHEDTNPSFSVSVSKQIFKCFSCGEAGNIIKYVMKSRNFSFQNTVEFLNQEFNLQLNLESLDSKPARNYTEIELQALRAHENSAKIFVTELFGKIFDAKLIGPNSEKSLKIQSFLKKRNLNRQIIEKFKIGWDPGNILKDRLVNSNLKFDELVLQNYSLLNNFGGDFFQNRLVFPIENDEGKIVGFSGRCLENEKCEPKYLNSVGNSLFSKSEILYNFATVIKETASKELILTEGFFDVIAFYKAGIKNAIGLMGTSLSKKHCQILAGHDIIIALDDDNAGKIASIKTARMLAENNINSYVLTNLEGLDPDDFFNKFGAQGLIKLLKNRQNSIDFAYEFYKNEIVKKTSEEIKTFIKQFKPFLEFLGRKNDKTTLGFFLKKMENELGIPEKSVDIQLKNYYKNDYELEFDGHFLENTHKKPPNLPIFPKITPTHCELKTVALILKDFIWGQRKLFKIFQKINYKFLDPKNANIIKNLNTENSSENVKNILILVENEIKQNLINAIYQVVESIDVIPNNPINEKEFLEWISHCESLRERFNKNNMQQRFLNDSENETTNAAFESIYPTNK
ncbi:DNA primase [Mycoplasma sp. 'Moose RK']|uniref:DNA primase n=1 Tax=Mycoplasma sp. 'Moose RK' TaxID=2780095 RepID=UPI0018C1F648|nr:DNA primase [Mycoplasma sp. 'Moose RK']MBG0731030.1 DNA primase [Mycoplasma sp. 'Moose RK']